MKVKDLIQRLTLREIPPSGPPISNDSSFSNRENDLLDNLNLGKAFYVFFILVRLRNAEKIVYFKKTQFQEKCGLGSHNTLNKYIEVIKKSGLINLEKRVFQYGKTEKSHGTVYNFPFADNPDLSAYILERTSPRRKRVENPT